MSTWDGGPALSLDEWEREGCEGLYTDGSGNVFCGFQDDVPIDRHGAAALCLNDQPYGVCHEMADAINKAEHGEPLTDFDRGWLRTAVSVILSLLPQRSGDNDETVFPM